MGTEQELRESITATKSVVKSAQRSLRQALHFLSDLEQRLDAVTTAKPGGRANGTSTYDPHLFEERVG